MRKQKGRSAVAHVWKARSEARIYPGTCKSLHFSLQKLASFGGVISSLSGAAAATAGRVFVLEICSSRKCDGGEVQVLTPDTEELG